MKAILVAATAAIVPCLGIAAAEREGAPCRDWEFSWGGIEPHPAVVNPALAQSGADVISLRGTWTFSKPDKDRPNRNGPWSEFHKRERWQQARDIQVPGCWEAQGVGEPGMSECWDPLWDNSAKNISHKYMGEGWYRKDVDIPASWAGKRIWIKFGGVKSVGWVWVNGTQVAQIDNYCATVKYEITNLVEPGGKARIVVDVDNRKPSRKGLMSAMHKWGGIYRDVELEATPQRFIDDAWVRGDFDRREAEVHVEVCGDAGGVLPDGLRLRAEIEGESAEMAAKAGDNVLRLPLKTFRAWSPERPNLYTAVVELVERGMAVHSRQERFGVRKYEVRGDELFLNGKPFFVRGFGDDCVYPIDGVSPADRDFHRRHLRKAKEAGFNFVRLHTHCEVPEYFEAADEIGIMIQAELPYYSDVPTEGFGFDPRRDATELWRNFRRHPSFAVYSMGNEGSFGDSLDRTLHRYVKAMDPDRLKINQDTNHPRLSTADRSDYAGGPIKEWKRGSYNPGRPFVTHEYLNLCVKSDSRIEGKYTGAWAAATTRDARGRWLAKFGLGHDWGDMMQDAQHALQAVWQKRGIESARIDPYCDGYSFWTIVDVVVWNEKAQAFTSQGLFDPFWDDKPKGSTAADFAAFNSPSCVLADVIPDRSVFVAGERFKVDVHLAHYGEEPMADARLEWGIGAAVKAVAIGDQAIGAVRKVATVDMEVPQVERPTKVKLVMKVKGAANSGEVANSWDLWLFPKGPDLAAIRARADRLGVTIAGEGSAEAERALAEGRPLVSVGKAEGRPNVNLGWWWMGAQVGTAIRPHRALGAFPHEGALSPLMFRILKRGKELPVAGVSPDEMVIVGEGGEMCYLYLAVRQVGRSKVVECHGLDVLSDLPEANALLGAFVDYLAASRQPPSAN